MTADDLDCMFASFVDNLFTFAQSPDNAIQIFVTLSITYCQFGDFLFLMRAMSFWLARIAPQRCVRQWLETFYSIERSGTRLER